MLFKTHSYKDPKGKVIKKKSMTKMFSKNVSIISFVYTVHLLFSPYTPIFLFFDDVCSWQRGGREKVTAHFCTMDYNISILQMVTFCLA